MPEKAFGYIRGSGKGQLDGDGFVRQESAIRDFGKAKGLRIVKVFREEAVSGTKELENRPALRSLLEALHSNGTKLVLVEKLNRLARDLMLQESIIHDLQRNGFRLISVAEPDLCSGDASRKLMRQIMGAFSEYEREMIVLKLKGARQRMKARTGRCEGAKPFGFYEGEAAVLERIRSLRSQNTPYDKIARQLNSEGIASRRGGKWHPFTVSKILARPDGGRISK